MGLLVTFKNYINFMALLGPLVISLLLAGCNAEKVETFELTVTEVTPSYGPTTGGTLIYLTGTSLKYTKSVTIGGEECTGLTINSDTQITCTTPEGTEGNATILVTNSIAKSTTSTFTYQNVPVIEDIDPRVGPLTGGTTITITGSGFVDGLSVDMGGTTCASITVVDSETIECTTAVHAAGYVVTKVTNPDGKYGTSRLFAYRNQPTVSSISPNGGDIAGGTVVTISGNGFNVGATATVGGVNCTFLTVVSTSQIRCTTGVHGAGLVDVEVTNNTGLAGTGANLYTYRSPPTVSSITPTSGFAPTTTSITNITGTGFLAGASVFIGATQCTGVTVVNPTTITCTAQAASAGVYDVSVINTDNQVGTLDDGFEYVAPPSITSISPLHGVSTGGTEVTITGVNFQAAPTVTLGGVACVVDLVQSNSTSIKCTTGAYLAGGKVDLVVTNPDTQSDTEINYYTYRLAPTITSVSPTSGPTTGSTAVTITGTGFYTGATVDFGGGACTGVNVTTNGQTITCYTPGHAAGGVTVKVRNDDAQEDDLVGGFTYQSPPTITSITPSRGIPSGGTNIVLTGTNFFAGAAVTFTTSSGPRSCTAVNVVSTTQINCTTPAAPDEGPVTVTVTNTDTQSGSSLGGFNFQEVLLDWDVTTYSFGNSTTDIVRTYTLTNTGEVASEAVTLSFTGTNPTAFSMSAASCPAIAPFGGTCTIDVTFKGATLAMNNYSANLFANTPSSDTATSALSGTVVDATLEWNALTTGDHGTVVVDDTIIITLDNSGTSDSTDPTFTLVGGDSALWTIDSDNCGASMVAGTSCTVTVTFDADAAVEDADNYTDLQVSAVAGGTATIQLHAKKDALP